MQTGRKEGPVSFAWSPCQTTSVNAGRVLRGPSEPLSIHPSIHTRHLAIHPSLRPSFHRFERRRGPGRGLESERTRERRAMAACRILIPARCEDACCGVARVAPAAATATAAASSSGFYGKSVRIGGRSAADLQRRAGLWRSLAVAEKVIVDGVVKAEEKVANAAAEVEEPAIEEEPVSLAAAEVKSFLADVSNLVKLVDSKDIVELELKNKNYEIIIRKAEALAPPPSAAPPVAAPLPYPMFAPPAFGPMAAPAPAAAAAPAPAAAEAAEAPQAAPAAPQFPPMLSPMAGNFYRSPGPGEPAFVKVGDKVRKGQALCIIEAMKLMNSIESDQDGTIVEIIAEDGKPVSADDPLFVIKP